MGAAPRVDRAAAEAAIAAFLRALGHDPATSPELVDTPSRVTTAYLEELCNGYAVDPVSVVRAHVMTGQTALVALRNVTVTTMCPHHLMPAQGLGTIAFAPGTKLIGLGALGQLLDAFAHRLILQEDIGERVAAVLNEELDARWSGCRLVLTHTCVTARGERKHGTSVETVAFVGDAADRAEALQALRGDD